METTHCVTPTRKSPRTKHVTPPRVHNQSPSPSKKQKTSPNNLSFKEASPSPKQRRKSLRRSVGKKHRRTLPPIYQNATELSEAISLALPESERLSELLQSCFQFTLRKLENTLRHTDGFNAESFSASVLSVKEKLERLTERFSRDGTFQRCTDRATSLKPSEESEAIEAQIKGDISKFSTECQRWEELLEDYKKKSEALSRQLEETKETDTPPVSSAHLPTSQDHVLQSKPDYSAIMRQQGAVFNCMEIVLDELHQSIQFLNSFLDDNSSHLQHLSTQLKSRSFTPMENSPVRAFLRVFQK
ncbi:kinetochore-associated protein DSN1 homolog [Mixophyes fleayi]|uniref:kinetochore-associated protein DSN1 homolog n=1 Tax=Mixophyes fleayi TaxID=3061075 RepID=UPI003F4DC929